MRLIDADMIEFVLPRTLTEEEKNTYNLVIKKAFDNTPTVKAIPVEWIMWDWRRKQPDDTQEDAWMRLGVLKMLRDWRKENEKDI